MNNMDSLLKEILILRKEIYTDAYSMSIGELANLYIEEELDIHPEFQRLFRWNDSQKTRLIESVLLDIPMPSIFVSQNNDNGVWDVVDGVQRLSTFFEFMGILKDNAGQPIAPLVLEKTKYLPMLSGVSWKKQIDNPMENQMYFPKELQMYFKRYRIDIKIVKEGSDPSKKYELFQRLNTGGSKLSSQEIRNCLMVMTNPRIYELFLRLANDPNFITCTPLTDRKIDEQFRLELITRFIVAKYSDNADFIRKYKELDDLFEDEIIRICNDPDFNISAVEKIFKRIFMILIRSLDENAFKAYRGGKFTGQFLTSAFLTIMIGMSENLEDYKLDDNKIKDKIISMHSAPDYIAQSTPGTQAISRFVALTRFGKEFFSNENK